MLWFGGQLWGDGFRLGREEAFALYAFWDFSSRAERGGKGSNLLGNEELEKVEKGALI